MQENGQIYFDDAENIPDADRQRLIDAQEIERLREEFKEREAQIRKLSEGLS